MEYYVLDKTSASCVLSFVNQALGSDLKNLAEFCILNVKNNSLKKTHFKIDF